MDDGALSDSTGTIDDEWVKDGDVSITSLPNNDSKAAMSSPSFGSQLSELELKSNRWARLLGVANRPNPLDDWDQLYNLPNQSGLRNDCRQLAKALGNKKSVPELESFMTLYCKKRQADYKKDSGWIEVFQKLLKFDIPQDHLFNVFFAFTTKYIPKETKECCQIYDLFRLILQYHDPEVNSHLESLKCTPYKYTKDIFSTVLASSLEDEICRALWDLYLEKGDPFLMFYMAVVLVINARDKILEFKPGQTEETVTFLKELPSQLLMEDVSDFVQLSLYYADRTPRCLREDFHYLIFGVNYDDDNRDLSVSKLMCFPIAVHEVARRDKGAVLIPSLKYFVIDCRSQEAFSNGHMFGSFNLDARLLVDNPEQFNIALESLESYKNDQNVDDHLCFLGYGDEAMDQFVYMVIAKFLRDGKCHVSLTQGGYAALHAYLVETNRLQLIVSHNTSKCSECKSTGKSWNLVGKMKEVVISKSASVKEKVSTLVLAPVAGESDVHHVTSADRHGKRYRNEPSIFSIDDGSSDEESAVFSKPSVKEKLLLAEQVGFIDQFSCHEVADKTNMLPSHIALTRTHIHILRDVPNRPGYVTTEARHPLSSVLRVTSKKRVPELMTFKFGYEINDETKVTAVHRFLIPKAGECAKAVKMAIFAMRPLSEPVEGDGDLGAEPDDFDVDIE